MKKYIIGYVIGAIMFGSIGVYASYKYNASDVSYKDSDVESAIGDLYDKIKGPKLFATDSWDTIIAAVRKGNTSTYRVGDTKEIDMGTFGKHTVRIANMSKPSQCNNANFSQTACGFVIEFVDIITTRSMNTSKTNVGGWPASELRTYLNNTVYNKLPSVLKTGIIDTKVVSGHGSTSGETNFTSTDKLYLLTVGELNGYCGSDYCTEYDYSRRLDYWGDNRTIKKYNGTPYIYWTRAIQFNQDYTFMCMSTNDGGYSNTHASNEDVGVSPAFRIG